jgi:hypothetical protein
MKEPQLFKWDPNKREYNLIQLQDKMFKPEELDSVFVTGNQVRIYLKKMAKL